MPGFNVEPASDDLFTWIVGMYGAPGTIYEVTCLTLLPRVFCLIVVCLRCGSSLVAIFFVVLKGLSFIFSGGVLQGEA